MDNPILYGYCSQRRQHYKHYNCWGATNQQRTAPITQSQSDIGDDSILEEPVLLLDVLKVIDDTASSDDEATEKPIAFDFSKYTYPERNLDKEIWLKPNPKALSSKKTVAEMLTVGSVSLNLATKGIIPVVVLPDPQARARLVKVPFGPMLDEVYQPYPTGELFKAAAIYDRYRLKRKTGHSEAWANNIWMANAIILRVVEKNGLPLEQEVVDGQSPIGEILRIRSSRKREGFEFHGSGGNPVVNGATPADANSKGATSSTGARDGATFETNQSVSNKLNLVMEQICERGTPIVVFAAGKVLPDNLANKKSQKDEQALLMGVYQVKWCAQEDPKTPSHIQAILEKYKPYYPDLSVSNLRFHLETPKKFRLLPLEMYSDRPGGYHHLVVDSRDNRKPVFEISEDSSYQNILSSMSSGRICSERSMFSDWVQDRGYLELIEQPYLAPGSTMDSVADTTLRPLQLIDDKEERVAKKMSHVAKRKQKFDDHFGILARCSIAAFVRMLEINVDEEGKIGQLIDMDPTYHKGPSALSNYTLHFGEAVAKERAPASSYLSLLGPELQKSPITHPIRSYDPKVMVLMYSNGGPDQRSSRHGLEWMEEHSRDAADLFFQCVLVKVVRVQVLLEWSLCKHPEATRCQLPVVSEIPSFVEYIEQVLRQTGASTANPVTQEQYEIHGNYGDIQMFRQFFNHLQKKLESWLSGMLVKLQQVENKGCTDTFGEANKLLTAFLNSESAIGEASTKQPFQSQHILMNYNEVVADFPFGEPECPVVGPGGKFGAQLLQADRFDVSNRNMVTTVMTGLLGKYKEQSPSDLTLMGLNITKGNTMVNVKINNRPLTVCDAEHGCCENYYIVERRPGCTKGISRVPKLAFTYCHPIPTCDYRLLQEAIDATAEFKTRVDAEKWEDFGSDDKVLLESGQPKTRDAADASSSSDDKVGVDPFEQSSSEKSSSEESTVDPDSDDDGGEVQGVPFEPPAVPVQMSSDTVSSSGDKSSSSDSSEDSSSSESSDVSSSEESSSDDESDVSGTGERSEVKVARDQLGFISRFCKQKIGGISTSFHTTSPFGIRSADDEVSSSRDMSSSDENTEHPAADPLSILLPTSSDEEKETGTEVDLASGNKRRRLNK